MATEKKTTATKSEETTAVVPEQTAPIKEKKKSPVSIEIRNLQPELGRKGMYELRVDKKVIKTGSRISVYLTAATYGNI